MTTSADLLQQSKIVMFASARQMSNHSRGTAVEERRTLLHCLDEALDVYGLSVKQVVYWKFEKTHHLQRSEISSHPEEFVETIRTIFGKGTSSIERDIARELHHRMGMPHIESSEDLASVIRKLDSLQASSKKA